MDIEQLDELIELANELSIALKAHLGEGPLWYRANAIGRDLEVMR